MQQVTPIIPDSGTKASTPAATAPVIFHHPLPPHTLTPAAALYPAAGAITIYPTPSYAQPRCTGAAFTLAPTPPADGHSYLPPPGAAPSQRAAAYPSGRRAA